MQISENVRKKSTVGLFPNRFCLVSRGSFYKQSKFGVEPMIKISYFDPGEAQPNFEVNKALI